MKMRRKYGKRIRMFVGFRRCRYCGYSGGGWRDSGECPVCGEVN